MAEHFDPTLRTWIGEQLAGGEAGLGEVREHVMATYFRPLCIYYRSTSWYRGRALGHESEAEDVVAGFFADRLSRSDYLATWEQSGKRLRHWLINGLLFYLREERRRWLAKAAPLGEIDIADAPDELGPAESDDVVLARGLVTRALELTEAECKTRGLEPHGRILRLRYFEEKSERDIADRLGKTPGQIKGYTRLVTRMTAKHFRTLLERDGVPTDRIDDEIQSLLEVTSA